VRTGTAVTGTAPTGLTKLADLNSYRYTMKIEGNATALTDAAGGFGTPGSDVKVAYSGAYVKPDRGQQQITLGDSLKVDVITIGRQQWTGIGGTYGAPESASRTPEDYSAAIGFWDNGFMEDAGDLRCSGNRETINGIQTRTCGIDSAAFSQLSDLLGGVSGSGDDGFVEYTNVSFQLWIAEPGGYIVRLRMDIAGHEAVKRNVRMHIELDVMNVNDTSIRINPP
jgi:hypothetical protein